MPERKRLQLKALITDLALQRCKLLYRMAVAKVHEGDYEGARHFVLEALRLLRRVRVRKPRFLRRNVCKNCYLPLIPGLTARIRLVRDGRESWVAVTCLVCGYVRRYRFKRRRASGAEVG